MCPCWGDHVCGYHFTQIEGLYNERRDLEAREQTLTMREWDRLRQVRGALLLEGHRAAVVIHQIKTREWEAAK